MTAPLETEVPPGLRSRGDEWFLVTSVTIGGAAREVWIPIAPDDLFEQLFSRAIAPRLRNENNPRAAPRGA